MRPRENFDPEDEDYDGKNDDGDDRVGHSIAPLSDEEFYDVEDDEGEDDWRKERSAGAEGVLTPPTSEFLDSLGDDEEEEGEDCVPEGFSATEFLELRTFLRSLEGLLPDVEVSPKVRAAIDMAVSGDLSPDEVLSENPEEVLSAMRRILEVSGFIPR